MKYTSVAAQIGVSRSRIATLPNPRTRVRAVGGRRGARGGVAAGHAVAARRARGAGWRRRRPDAAAAHHGDLATPSLESVKGAVARADGRTEEGQVVDRMCTFVRAAYADAGPADPSAPQGPGHAQSRALSRLSSGMHLHMPPTQFSRSSHLTNGQPHAAALSMCSVGSHLHASGVFALATPALHSGEVDSEAQNRIRIQSGQCEL